ncbi:hypothetical protein [Microbacterium sp. No. 7]|uniref:hypothetical protein n=1 Tax=Microbacterium sp. No. 7 TaxID=1714373 RepID=UPI0006D05CD2|nr:hypothetical protein [Microbacterium sp. No. 7]ALJ21038.1 hypothetical protein AOA12_14470 [Microbacterium sp. No. 7]
MTRFRGIAMLGLAGALALAACASSPTTTYTDAAGAEVTVDWKSYPAHAGMPAETALLMPAAGQVEERESQLIAEIGTTLADELGLPAPEPRGDGGWYPQSGNGYGGSSMLTTYNGPEWTIDAAIDPDDWPRVLGAVERVLRPHGLAPRDGIAFETSWQHGRDFGRDLEWMYVSVGDARLDEEALAEAERHGWLVSGVTLSYGVTTIDEADVPAFERAAAPFAGLDLPRDTHSD